MMTNTFKEKIFFGTNAWTLWGWTKRDIWWFSSTWSPNFTLVCRSKVTACCLYLATRCCRQGANLELGAGVPSNCQRDVTCSFRNAIHVPRAVHKTSWILHDGNYFLYIKKWLFAILTADLITCRTCSENRLQPLKRQSRLLQREGNRRCNRSSWLLMHMTTFLPA